ncbi:MAG TPA: hypothetical protein VGQ83_17970 [Polyangia bacterium]|jgi:L-fucose isomerase-like protein
MLRIAVLVSELHGADARERLGGAFARRLAAAGLAHELVAVAPAVDRAPPAPAADAAPLALALLTGGTEAAALAVVARAVPAAAPVILLTHELHNGFPAALEVAARLRQDGRRVRVVQVPDGAPAAPLARTLTALAAHQALRQRRLALVGGPSSWLAASAPADELVAAVWGVRVERLPIAAIAERFGAIAPARAAAVAEDLITASAGSAVGRGEVEQAARLALATEDLCRAGGHDAITVRCFDLLGALGTTGCLALSRLLDAGVIAGCEGDVPTTLTMMWLAALTGATPFMANPQAVDEAAGVVALAHCTIARGLLESYRLDTHFESGIGVALAGRLPRGPVTLARIGGADLRELFVADGELVAGGDSPDRCRTQVEVRLGGAARELLERPLGNHHVLIPGHHAALARAAHALFIKGTLRGSL